MRPIELLRQLADDDRAGRVGEALELTEMLVERLACAGPLERCSDEERALDRRRNRDQIACDG